METQITLVNFKFYNFTGLDYTSRIYKNGIEIGSYNDLFGVRLLDGSEPSLELRNECFGILKEYKDALLSRKGEHTFELTSVKIYERMSKETTCFSSKLKVDGKVIGECKNDGGGGSTNVYGTQKTLNEFKLIENWCNELKFSLDGFVDYLLEKHIEELEITKLWKKLEKQMVKGLVIEEIQNEKYHTVGWNFELINLESFPNRMNVVCNKIIDLKKEGKKIINTNLPKNLIFKYGVHWIPYFCCHTLPSEVYNLLKNILCFNK